jgi:hypothetical protein
VLSLLHTLRGTEGSLAAEKGLSIRNPHGKAGSPDPKSTRECPIS